MYKLACVNCEKVYIGRTNINFKTGFKERKKDFICGEGHSNFCNHKVEEDDKMKNMDNILKKINKLGV